MLKPQRIVRNNRPTRIKGPSVRALELPAKTHSPIPDLHENSAVKTGCGFD
jgi:hypothetical protein